MKRLNWKLVAIINAVVASGCSSYSPVSLGPDQAYVAAADENFFSVMSSNKTTTRLDAINGISTGSGRFNRGSGHVKPGPVALLIRLWGEKMLSAPSETYTCIKFNAEAGKQYLISTTIVDRRYEVAISNLVSDRPIEIAKYTITYGEDARIQGCN
jgi:hypothetical protein